MLLDQNLPATRRRPAPQTGRNIWMGLLSALLHLAGGRAQLMHHAERAWASATFAGSRHTVTLTFVGAEAVAAADTLIAALPDHEFDVPGYLVADAAIVAADHSMLPEPAMTVVVELLLLEDDQ